MRCPYLKTEWIEHVLSSPIRKEVQANGRIRCWGFIAEVGKYLRVINEPDGEGASHPTYRWSMMLCFHHACSVRAVGMRRAEFACRFTGRLWPMAFL
jgi:hypothetical protein